VWQLVSEQVKVKREGEGKVKVVVLSMDSSFQHRAFRKYIQP
jgi:hypothetical protein